MMMIDNAMEEAGRNEHCLRVAAYCAEIAINLGLSMRDRALLRQAALNHHRPGFQIDRSFLPRIASDLNIGLTPELIRKTTAYDELVASFAGSKNACSQNIRELAEIVEVADHFDEELEFSPYAAASLSKALKQGSENSLDNPAIAFILPLLRGCEPEDLQRLTPMLPVFPKAAMEVLRYVRRREMSVDGLAQLAGSDQVLAGALIRNANSAAYSHIDPVRDLKTAVMYIGTQRAADLLCAAAVKPILMVPDFRDLWQHSIDVANAAQTLARKTKHIAPADAYLTGLLHDVGKLLLRLAPGKVPVVRHRLIEAGCAPAVAEVLTCGINHAEAGGMVLRHWQMPDDYVSAVECHHEPERSNSPLASLLYLVEHWADAEEDLPSVARLNGALEKTGLQMSDLDHLRVDATAARIM